MHQGRVNRNKGVQVFYDEVCKNMSSKENGSILKLVDCALSLDGQEYNGVRMKIPNIDLYISRNFISYPSKFKLPQKTQYKFFFHIRVSSTCVMCLQYECKHI